MKYTFKDLRSELYIDDIEYNDFFKEHKKDFKKVIKKINKDNTLIPVFESDLQYEEEYLQECGKKIIIAENINGIILYRKEVL